MEGAARGGDRGMAERGLHEVDGRAPVEAVVGVVLWIAPISVVTAPLTLGGLGTIPRAKTRERSLRFSASSRLTA